MSARKLFSVISTKYFSFIQIFHTTTATPTQTIQIHYIDHYYHTVTIIPNNGLLNYAKERRKENQSEHAAAAAVKTVNSCSDG